MSTCEACGQREAVAVVCVPFVAYSTGYCQQCLDGNVHPWPILVGNTAGCGGLIAMTEAWRQMVRDTIAQTPGRTMEHFDAAVVEAMTAQDEMV